jgi:hypothetical protein
MRQFPQDDDVDYDDLRRRRAEDRESIKEIRDSLKIDEDDLFAKLAEAAARSMGGDHHGSPAGGAAQYGRNDMVAITNGTETKEMKYKKAEELLRQGWTIV